MADDWTVVKPKKGRRTKPTETHVSNETCSSCADISNTLDKDATHASLTKELKRWTADWHRLKLMDEIKDLIANMYIEDNLPITKAICMGVGNLATVNMDNLVRSMRQLSVFLELVKHFENTSGTRIQMYVQEPRLFDIDKSFLISLGFQILEMPVTTKSAAKKAQLGPMEAYLDLNTLVADFFVEFQVTKALAGHAIGFLVSPWPGIKDPTFGTTQMEWFEMMEWLKASFVYYEFPHRHGEPVALQGLYLCGSIQDVEDEEDDDEVDDALSSGSLD